MTRLLTSMLWSSEDLEIGHRMSPDIRMSKIAHIKTLLSENRTVRQTILKNTFWLSFGEVIGRLIKAAIVIYAARVLGAAGFGVFSYIMGLAGLLTLFSDLGMGAVIIREGAKDPQLRARYFSTALTLNLILSLASAIIIIFGAPFVTNIPVSQTLVIFVALLFVFESLRGLIGSSLFQAIERMEGGAVVNIITQAFIVIAGFILITKFRNPESLALAYALGSAVGLAVAVYLLRHHIRGFISRFDRTLIKPMLSAAIPVSLASIMGAVMINTDTVLLGWLTGAREVGFYAAAQKPVLLLYMISSFIAWGTFPALARFAGKDSYRFRLLTEKTLAAVFFFAFPITAGLLLTSGEVIELLYGAPYLPATLTFQILSLTLLVVLPWGLLFNGIFAYNQQKFLTKIGVIGVLVNAGLDLVFIPTWGIAGSALVTLIVQIFTGASVWFKMKQLNNFSVLGSLKKIAFATLVMSFVVLALLFIKTPILFTALAGAVAYGGVLILSRETLLRDLRAILAGS